jgi:hypothetical protein
VQGKVLVVLQAADLMCTIHRCIGGRGRHASVAPCWQAAVGMPPRTRCRHQESCCMWTGGVMLHGAPARSSAGHNDWMHVWQLGCYWWA